MEPSLRTLRFRLQAAGLLPTTRLARAACYLLGLDLLLFALQRMFGLLQLSYGQALGGWVSILSFLVIVLFALLAIRSLKARLLWRLRNRLIVTYVFFGLIPVVLLVVLALGSAYLFAGQFATFIVTTELDSELSSLQAANSALAHALAAWLQHRSTTDAGALESLRQTDKSWAGRQVYVWLGGKIILNSSPAGVPSVPPALPRYLKSPFRGVVRDQNQLFLRAAEILPVSGGYLTVLSNESLDQHRLQTLATDLGEISLYASGLTIRKVNPTQAVPDSSNLGSSQADTGEHATIGMQKRDGDYVLDTGKEPLIPRYTAGAVPSPANRLDRQISFATSIAIVNWDTGDTSNPAALGVQTRVSKLYDRLFGALGDLAPAIEVSLLIVAFVFGVIEMIALLIGYRLTRSVTGAVAQLYDATTHINRGDFSHRISVKSNDQLAALANSFNSMTASIENLIEEQKEKQRLQNELTIAQEVQSQLFPQHISQLASLEVYGFCRPARTVSGDYYDFLTLDAHKIILAVGDVSGKGISAALLMATIHSAVRAHSLEGISSLREPVAVGADAVSDLMPAPGLHGAEVSSGALLSLLNHQLYQSTPAEKYATLFLGIYDGQERKLTYSNGGHLPPIILGEDGSRRRLERGGTVIGLFDHKTYEEGSVALRRGELLLAYSDGVTEPENDFGEFGEQRLIDLVWNNRDLPLARISDIVTGAVDDWIGANEQPDDITLVLARGR
jgi:phosphoserine phosphatase RsbU/P